MNDRGSFRAIGLTAAVLACLMPSPAEASGKRICAPASVAAILEDLSESHPGLEIVSTADHADLLAKVADCTAVVGLYGRGAAEVVAAAPELEWIQSSSAGVERFVGVPALRDSDVVLTNTKIIQGPEIADHAMALLLNFTRDLKFFNEQMSTGFDRRSRLPMIELQGKTALIIGLGGIGTQVAQRAAAFGMRVVAVDPKDIPVWRDVAYVGPPDELDGLLPEADVVFSCVPITAESREMLGPQQFELMKDGVYLINVSRGGVVDTAALTLALQSGKVRAAGLDVTEPEPLPAGHPLWQMPNVTITPHLATASDRLEERRRELYRDNVVRYLNGDPLRNVVDKQKGY